MMQARKVLGEKHACGFATHIGQALHSADLEVLDKILGIFAQLAIEDGFTASLQQQQLIKGFKDVDAGLVDGAHNGPACVDDVAHSAHHNGSSSGIQACSCRLQQSTNNPLQC